MTLKIWVKVKSCYTWHTFFHGKYLHQVWKRSLQCKESYFAEIISLSNMVMSRWHWRYGLRSKVFVHNTEKLWSGHDLVYRQTDGQMDEQSKTSLTPSPSSAGYNWDVNTPHVGADEWTDRQAVRQTDMQIDIQTDFGIPQYDCLSNM